MDKMMIAKRVRDLRTARGISQKALAEELEITPTYMSYIETGAKHFGLETAKKLSAYFDVPLGYLLGDDDDQERPAPPDTEEIRRQNEEADDLRPFTDLQAHVLTKRMRMSDEAIESALLIMQRIEQDLQDAKKARQNDKPSAAGAN